MFRTVPLFIIRSFSLYTQEWVMTYSFADSLGAESGWNSGYMDLTTSETCAKTEGVGSGANVCHLSLGV
jgi:hypothetical protein